MIMHAIITGQSLDHAYAIITGQPYSCMPLLLVPHMAMYNYYVPQKLIVNMWQHPFLLAFEHVHPF